MKKKLEKKLVVDKKTISKLQDADMQEIKGASVIWKTYCCDPGTDTITVIMVCCQE